MSREEALEESVAWLRLLAQGRLRMKAQDGLLDLQVAAAGACAAHDQGKAMRAVRMMLLKMLSG